MEYWRRELYHSELYHYGVKHRSGRYPYGSGERPYQDVEISRSERKAAREAGRVEKYKKKDDLMRKWNHEQMKRYRTDIKLEGQERLYAKEAKVIMDMKMSDIKAEKRAAAAHLLKNSAIVGASYAAVAAFPPLKGAQVAALVMASKNNAGFKSTRRLGGEKEIKKTYDEAHNDMFWDPKTQKAADARRAAYAAGNKLKPGQATKETLDAYNKEASKIYKDKFGDTKARDDFMEELREIEVMEEMEKRGWK